MRLADSNTESDRRMAEKTQTVAAKPDLIEKMEEAFWGEPEEPMSMDRAARVMLEAQKEKCRVDWNRVGYEGGSLNGAPDPEWLDAFAKEMLDE